MDYRHHKHCPVCQWDVYYAEQDATAKCYECGTVFQIEADAEWTPERGWRDLSRLIPVR